MGTTMADHKLVPLDPELHHYLKARALSLNKTLSQLLEEIVQSWVNTDKTWNQLQGGQTNV